MRDHEVPASAPDPTQQVAEDLTFFSPTRTTRAMSHKIKNFIEGNDEEEVSPPRRAQKRQLGDGEDEDEDEDFDEFSVSDNDADDGDYYDRGGGRKTKRTGVPKALEPPYPPVPRQAYENYELSTHNVYEYYDIEEQKKMVREHNESRDAYSQFREMIQSAEETFPKTRPTPSEVKTEDKMDLQDSEEQPKEDEHVKSNDQHVSENSTNDAEPITQPAEVPSVSAAPVENAPVTNVENGPIVATLPSNNLAEAPAPAVDNEPTSQAQQETLSETKTSDAMEEDKPEEKQQSEKQTTDAMEDDDIDDELLASVRKAKTEQTDDSSTPKRKRGRPKKGTGPSESTPRMIPSPPQPSPRRTPIPPRYAHEEEFKVSTEPVNRVSSDFAAIQSFDDEESILKQILIAESRTDIPDGQIELRCLADYKSILDRKQRAKEKEEKKRTPKKMKKAEEEEEDFSNGLHQLAEDFIQKSLGDPSSTYQLRKYRDGTYINCDLRYFNLSSLGKFDMVLIDPPWRIGGGQRHGEQSAVFSNCNFKLQYNTMSNEEIMDLDVESLSDQGFCFLWVLNSTLQFGLDLLNKWGYTFVEKIVWVKKSRHHDTMVNVTHGYYLLHSTEMVLIGMKSFSMNKKKGLTSAGQPPPKEGDMTQRLQYISKVSNDLLFGKVSKQSQKPDQLYQVIESMMPGARKVELFARNNNIREGWLSLGNRLGHTFDTFDQDWQWTYSCNECQVDLSPIPFQRMNVERGYVRKDTKAAARSHKRFKSKIEPGIDLCENCVTHDQHGPIENYFEIENLCEEPIYHDWYNCDNCDQRPICGVRFSCTDCENYDLCETCFDQVIMTEKKHTHGAARFDFIELPDPGMGFPVHHRIRCTGCLVCPIIGERFHCLECSIDLCRKCFFLQKDTIKGHDCNTHTMSLIPEHASGHKLKCTYCKKIKDGTSYKCKTCSNFVLCEACFEQHDELMPFEKFPTHKQFHRFFKLRAE